MASKIFLLVTSLLGIAIYALITTQLTCNDLFKGKSFQKHFNEVSLTLFLGGYSEKPPKNLSDLRRSRIYDFPTVILARFPFQILPIKGIAKTWNLTERHEGKIKTDFVSTVA